MIYKKTKDCVIENIMCCNYYCLPMLKKTPMKIVKHKILFQNLNS
jgi:hypothetical protein